MSDTDYYNVLRIRAYNDLTNRAKPGIFIYATIWFAIAFALNLYEENHLFFQINSALILIFFAIRFVHLLYSRNVDKDNVGTLEFILISSILFGALHWGIMSAWVFYDSDLRTVEAPILIVLAAFAMGGTSTLSISRIIRLYYPGLLFLPSVLFFLWEGESLSLLYAGMISASWVYIFVASRSAEQDYWQAVSNSLIAETRAEELEKLSATDALTQISNRMHFDAEYEKEWQRCMRFKSSISILMIDLDYFKKINDEYGHPFGDECLKKVASTLKEITWRPSDCVARYGGEEFIILLPNTNSDGVKIVAERVVSAVRDIQLFADEKPVQITCSIGAASTYPNPEKKAANLIKRADEALYKAKAAGRNHYIINTDE